MLALGILGWEAFLAWKNRALKQRIAVERQKRASRRPSVADLEHFRSHYGWEEPVSDRI